MYLNFGATSPATKFRLDKYMIFSLYTPDFYVSISFFRTQFCTESIDMKSTIYKKFLSTKADIVRFICNKKVSKVNRSKGQMWPLLTQRAPNKMVANIFKFILLTGKFGISLFLTVYFESWLIARATWFSSIPNQRGTLNQWVKRFTGIL